MLTKNPSPNWKREEVEERPDRSLAGASGKAYGDTTFTGISRFVSLKLVPLTVLRALYVFRYLAVFLAAITLSACTERYRMASYDKPTVQLDRQSSFYVTLPADGRHGAGSSYNGSAANTARAISDALLTHVDKTVIGTVKGETLEEAMARAKQDGLGYVFQTTILNWEDRLNLLSGRPDRFTLQFAVYDVQSGQEISAAISSATGKGGPITMGNPSKLLP